MDEPDSLDAALSAAVARAAAMPNSQREWLYAAPPGTMVPAAAYDDLFHFAGLEGFKLDRAGKSPVCYSVAAVKGALYFVRDPDSAE